MRTEAAIGTEVNDVVGGFVFRLVMGAVAGLLLVTNGLVRARAQEGVGVPLDLALAVERGGGVVARPFGAPEEGVARVVAPLKGR